MESLRRLASELSIPERTLRRAANEGLIHGERVSPRRFHATLREEMYLRSHWPLLRRLRSALRTEPNVRLAVLYGSVATGDDRERSDVDVLVVLADESVGRLADLAGRLSSRAGRDVQPVRLIDAEGSPPLMSDVLSRGRVLVDRGGRWPELAAQAERWRRLADRREHSGIETMDDLLPGREATS
jgi:predicted nucleotidyltransferase